MAGGGLPALAAVVSIPILLTHLSYQRFAIVSLLISLTVFFYVYDFGIGRAMGCLLPRGRQNNERTDEVVMAGLSLSVLLGTMAALLAYLGSPYLVRQWMQLNPVLVVPTEHAFQLVSIGILPSIVATTLRGSLEGASEFTRASIGKAFSGMAIPLAPAVLVMAGTQNIEAMGQAILLTRILAVVLFAVLLWQTMKLHAELPNSRIFNEIASYSGWAALAGFISTMFVYGDRLVVSRYLDAESLAVYISVQDVLIRFLLIPWAMAIVLMPTFAANKTAVDTSIIIYERQHKRIRNLALAVSLLIVISVVWLISSPYASDLSEHLFDVVVIQTVGVFFCAMAQLPLIYLYAKGRPKTLAFIFVAEGVVYLLIAPLLFKAYGLLGACFVWTGRLITEYMLLHHFTKRVMAQGSSRDQLA